MSIISDILNEALRNANESEDIIADTVINEVETTEHLNGRDHAMEMVKRLRELSGLTTLANSTSVAGKPVSDLYKK